MPQIKISYQSNPELEDSEFITGVKVVPRKGEKVFHKGSLYEVVDVVHDIYYDQVRVITKWFDKIKR